MKMNETISPTDGARIRPSYSYRDIWKIVFPLLLSSIVEQLIGMTDTAFLGRVGEVELSRPITPFLAAAQARGCTIQVATDMLFEQIPAYLEYFGLETTTPEVLRQVAQL